MSTLGPIKYSETTPLHETMKHGQLYSTLEILLFNQQYHQITAPKRTTTFTPRNLWRRNRRLLLSSTALCSRSTYIRTWTICDQTPEILYRLHISHEARPPWKWRSDSEREHRTHGLMDFLLLLGYVLPNRERHVSHPTPLSRADQP